MKNSEKNDPVSKIFERIKKILKVGTYAAVFRKMDMKRGTFDTWKQRGEIPEARMYELAGKLGVSKQWLETGEGSMFEKDASMTQTGNNSNQVSGSGNSVGNGMVKDSGNLYQGLPSDVETIVGYLLDMDKDQRKEVMKFVVGV